MRFHSSGMRDMQAGVKALPVRHIEIRELPDGTIEVESSEMTRRERQDLIQQARDVIQHLDAKYLRGESID
jgi:hypothetical protein